MYFTDNHIHFSAFLFDKLRKQCFICYLEILKKPSNSKTMLWSSKYKEKKENIQKQKKGKKKSGRYSVISSHLAFKKKRRWLPSPNLLSKVKDIIQPSAEVRWWMSSALLGCERDGRLPKHRPHTIVERVQECLLAEHNYMQGQCESEWLRQSRGRVTTNESSDSFL